jgi:hypothetical protein
MEYLIQRMGVRISTVATWLSKDCFGDVSGIPNSISTSFLGCDAREYVGACDEPQSETTLLLPVLPMATTQMSTAGRSDPL